MLQQDNKPYFTNQIFKRSRALFKKILVTGGQGYKGSVLVPKLLASGHRVTSLDTGWFGNYLSPHENLEVLEHDIRGVSGLDLTGYDTVIHLASIANPCGDLNPKLTWRCQAWRP